MIPHVIFINQSWPKPERDHPSVKKGRHHSLVINWAKNYLRGSNSLIPSLYTGEPPQLLNSTRLTLTLLEPIDISQNAEGTANPQKTAQGNSQDLYNTVLFTSHSKILCFCLHNANATQLQFNSVQKSFLVLWILLPGRFLNPGLKEVVFFKTQLVAEQINIIINFPHDCEAQKNLGATLPFLSLTILSPSSSFLYEGLQNFQPL